MLNQLSIGGNILQVANEHELEKHHRVNRRVACLTIERFCMLIEEREIECFLQPPVEPGGRGRYA